MSNEGVGEAGAERPVGVSEDGLGGLARVLRYISERAIGEHGDVSPSAQSLLSLRKQESREQELRRLVAAVCPAEINGEVWMKWLAGGEPPYKASVPRRPGTDDRSSGKQLMRKSGRISTAERKLDAAHAAVAEAEAELLREKAFDQAMMQWVVSEHIASILEPVFAMGPAWTLMRVVSAHVPPAVMEEETSMISDPRKRKLAEEMVRSERATATRSILATLDLWAGHDGFEREMRDAIAEVCARFEPRRRERAVDGETERGKERMATSVRPSAATDREDVIAGMKVEQEAA